MFQAHRSKFVLVIFLNIALVVTALAIVPGVASAEREPPDTTYRHDVWHQKRMSKRKKKPDLRTRLGARINKATSRIRSVSLRSSSKTRKEGRFPIRLKAKHHHKNSNLGEGRRASTAVVVSKSGKVHVRAKLKNDSHFHRYVFFGIVAFTDAKGNILEERKLTSAKVCHKVGSCGTDLVMVQKYRLKRAHRSKVAHVIVVWDGEKKSFWDALGDTLEAVTKVVTKVKVIIGKVPGV